MSALLEIRDLVGGYQEGVKVLQGINLSVEQGEAVGIIGLNGSGKSTLGKAIMNLLPYRSGKILFEGEDVTQLSTHELARKGIAMMHQGGVVFPNLTVWQNLQLAVGAARYSSLASQYGGIIPLLREPERKLMRTAADKLSGGQRHQLALAMTMAQNPQLIILDEPSAGLSPKAVEEMYEMLAMVQKKLGITVVLIEQNIIRAVDFCRRCFMVSQGTVARVFENEAIAEIEAALFGG